VNNVDEVLLMLPTRGVLQTNRRTRSVTTNARSPTVTLRQSDADCSPRDARPAQSV